MPGEDYDPATGRGTNYLRPFLKDVGRAATAGYKAVKNLVKPWVNKTKVSEPASGTYEHNSPAKPL